MGVTQFGYWIFAHVKAYRGLYFLAAAVVLGGLFCGWKTASGMDGDTAKAIAEMVDIGGELTPWSIFLSTQARWGLLLGWMTLAALSRWTLPLPPAVLFLQCFAVGLTLHTLAVIPISLLSAIVMLAAYGIMVLLSVPFLMMGAVLSLSHAARASGRPGAIHLSGLGGLIRNMIVLFFCGIPAAGMRCLLGLILR